MKKIIKIVIAIFTTISIVIIGLRIFFFEIFQPTFISIIEPNIQRPEISVSSRWPPSVPTTPSDITSFTKEEVDAKIKAINAHLNAYNNLDLDGKAAYGSSPETTLNIYKERLLDHKNGLQLLENLPETPSDITSLSFEDIHAKVVEIDTHLGAYNNLDVDGKAAYGDNLTLTLTSYKENLLNNLKIPEIFVDNLPKQQTKFLQTIDGFPIIETEMDAFFQDKTKERAIIFCFDINKKLIYCDPKNLNNHFKDITLEGTSTETSAFLNLSLINLLKSNNSNVFYWIDVHNHPSANSIHLPSENDLDTTSLDTAISNWYLETKINKKHTKIKINRFETLIQNTKQLIQNSKQNISEANQAISKIKEQNNISFLEYLILLEEIIPIHQKKIHLWQKQLIEYQENLRFRQEQLEELNNSMTLLDKKWFSLVWGKRVVSDYSRWSYVAGYKPSDGYRFPRDIFEYFGIIKNYTIYNLQNI